jgi:hypothetical protein
MSRTIASFEAEWDHCRKIGGLGEQYRTVSLQMWDRAKPACSVSIWTSASGSVMAKYWRHVSPRSVPQFLLL